MKTRQGGMRKLEIDGVASGASVFNDHIRPITSRVDGIQGFAEVRSKMIFNGRRSKSSLSLALVIAGAVSLGACGRGQTPYDKNLLKNPSFEYVKSGVPQHWQLAHFRGLEGESEVRYGIDNTTAADGKQSWFFDADPGTRRFHFLQQEVEVRDITHVRLQGWMQLDQVNRLVGQYAQCNFLVTFFDEKHERFQELRYADKRTVLKLGTIPWYEEDHMFRVPKGTRYVSVACALGCDGRVWFDNVSLSVPKPPDWQTRRTENFVFHWLPERPFPPGSIENEQLMFDDYAKRLGVKSDAVVYYYLYPDTASIRSHLSIKGHQYVSWDDMEIHVINPNEDHEIIHFITDPYGRPPRSIAEGTVFWLQGQWMGRPIEEISAFHLSIGRLPTIEDLIDLNRVSQLHPVFTMPAASVFVKFIVDRWGTERLMEFYRELNGVNSYDQFAKAFEKVYGVPCMEVEEQYRYHLSKVKFDKASTLLPVQ